MFVLAYLVRMSVCVTKMDNMDKFFNLIVKKLAGRGGGGGGGGEKKELLIFKITSNLGFGA